MQIERHSTIVAIVDDDESVKQPSEAPQLSSRVVATAEYSTYPPWLLNYDLGSSLHADNPIAPALAMTLPLAHEDPRFLTRPGDY
jgi:hypothetical protein